MQPAPYIIVSPSDFNAALSQSEQIVLFSLLAKIATHRQISGLNPLKVSITEHSIRTEGDR